MCVLLEQVKWKANEQAKYIKKTNWLSLVMEACLWSFYGGWIFELQWDPLMVIFHHGDAAEDKGEEVRGGAIH